MSNSTIIEVRQNDGQAISHSNSEWQVNLCQPVELKRNGEVTLKGVFLDTELNNVGKIIIPDNSANNAGVFIGSVSFMYYFFDWGTTTGFPSGATNERKYFPDKTYGDGFHYFLADSPTPAGQNYDLVSGANFFNAGTTHKNYANSDPEAFVFSFQYEQVGAPAGELSYLYCEVNKKFMDSKGISFNTNQGDKAFTFDSSFFEPDAQYTNKFYPNSANVGSFPVSCKTNTFAVNQTRKYEGTGNLVSPKENDPNGEGIVGERFFGDYGFFNFDFQKDVVNRTARHFHPRYNIAEFNIKSGAYTPEKLAETLTRELTITHSERLLDPQGSTGIANNILLTDTTTLKALGETKDGANPNTTPFFINETGDRVAFYDTSGTTNSYLIGTTQFAVSYQAGSTGGGKFQIDAIHTPIFSSDPNSAGEPVVRMLDYGAQALEPNNAVVRFFANKGTGIGITDLSPTSFWQTQLGFDTSMYLQVVEDTGYANTGYYLVEVTGNVINNKLVGAGQEIKTIMGIVNRYYMENAFLSATDGQGSFTYIHDGDDVTLQSVKIRILNDNYKPLSALEIKGNNAVFLEVLNPISQE